MRLFLIILTIVLIGTTGAMGILKLFEVNEFVSQDYTFIMFCGMISLAVLNAIGGRKIDGKDH